MSALSTFVDNYILVLAARFGAPVTPVRSSYDAGATEGEVESETQAWQLVAESLQDALAHPRTEQERRQLASIDVCAYSASVCRGRALHLKWQETVRQREQEEGGTRQEDERKPTAAGNGPSSFDITQNSLRDDVRFIHAAVRRCLPSTVVPEDATEDTQERDARLAVHDVFIPTPEEQQRDAAMATARDELLSQVQRLQAAFYEKHRRWVDVPEQLLDAPATRTGARAIGRVSGNGTRENEEAERANLLAMLHGTDSSRGDSSQPRQALSATDAIAALRRTLQVERAIPRPSATTSDDDIAKMYSAARVSPHAGAPHTLLRDNEGSRPQLRQEQLYREAIARKVAPVSAGTTTAAAAAAAPPAAAPARNGRWQIVEYDDEADASEEESDE